MNNRLKFRIWLPKLNKFGDPKNAFIDFNGNVYGITRPNINDTFSLINIKEFKEFDDAVLQQYTGLNDKNGKEVYEGDIVERGKLKYLVEWESNKWQARCPYYSRYSHPKLEHFRDVEYGIVVGNIFENKKLLK